MIIKRFIILSVMQCVFLKLFIYLHRRCYHIHVWIVTGTFFCGLGLRTNVHDYSIIEVICSFKEMLSLESFLFREFESLHI